MWWCWWVVCPLYKVFILRQDVESVLNLLIALGDVQKFLILLVLGFEQLGALVASVGISGPLNMVELTVVLLLSLGPDDDLGILHRYLNLLFIK